VCDLARVGTYILRLAGCARRGQLSLGTQIANRVKVCPVRCLRDVYDLDSRRDARCPRFLEHKFALVAARSATAERESCTDRHLEIDQGADGPITPR
jgi:hypothetical protein